MEGGSLIYATIESELGSPLKIRYKENVVEFPVKKGDSVTVNGNLEIIRQSEVNNL